jgi:CO/xanthine dehydrogenase FAD-binding subunit
MGFLQGSHLWIQRRIYTMAILNEYHRPETVREAIHLLGREEARLLPLAGGSRLLGELETRARRDVDGVVDLAGLGLNQIEVTEAIHVGATVTLSDLMTHPAARELAGGLLARALKCEGPINLRNQATVGGLITSAEQDSEGYAALLALGASVTVYDGEGETRHPLADFAPPQRPTGPWLITGVEIPLFSGGSGHARVARTPSDRPIVAALAVIDERGGEQIALCGAAPWPILAGTDAPAFSDFKGSAEYRQAMIPIVRNRALAEARGV